MIKNLTILGLLSFLAALLFVSSVQADSGQYGQYGGAPQAVSIVIDKQVGKAGNTKGAVVNYVDNFSPSDPRFSPGEKVYFQIKVKNTSNIDLSNIKVQDVLPEFIEPLEGPGTLDKVARTITYNIDSLKSGEEKINNVLATVVAQEKLPADRGLMCLVNKAQVTVNDKGDADTAQFCVEKQVVTAKQVPTAGPEFGLVLLTGYSAALAGGLFLKKKLSA